MAALHLAIGWRHRVTHRYEIVIAASAKTVWDTYFVHIKKADYRPGTWLVDATVLSEAPLTVRITAQPDFSSEPMQTTVVYDVWEPYRRYRLHVEDSDIVEEGTLTPDGAETRLQRVITTPMRGSLLPLLARRRVERNQRALKEVCEGREVPPPRGALPQLVSRRWESWGPRFLTVVRRL